MKLYIQYDLNDSGKGKFIQRLVPALERLGVECSFKEGNSDICLGISRWRERVNLPRVLRVDGIYLDSKEKREKWINKEVKKAIEQADAVIFQSQFAKRMVEKHLKPKMQKSYVIYNGANPQMYDVDPMPTGYECNVIASAKWCNRNGLRKSKGYKETIKALLKYKNQYTGLYVAGEVPEKKMEKSGITYLGHLNEIELRRWLQTCDTMVYMAETDWCPNAVVEAIIAGCKIIYNSECESVKELVEQGPEGLHIDNIAKQYKHVFEEVLCTRQ